MIKIHIGEPEKLSNNILVKKSAFVSFDYNPDIVNYIKQMGTRVYNPDNHTWEMPINNIIGLCNKFENEEIQSLLEYLSQIPAYANLHIFRIFEFLHSQICCK